jgi:hypothetical protein
MAPYLNCGWCQVMVGSGGRLRGRPALSGSATAGAGIGLRRQIADTSPGERGATVRQTLRAAGEIARELGHDYIGTEHQLFAIINDSTLSEALLPAGIREQASAHVHDLISGGPTDTRATGS